MDVGQLFSLSGRTPDRAYYENLSEEETTKIEETLNKHNVETFMGFNYWRFTKTGVEDKIMMRRAYMGLRKLCRECRWSCRIS